jgi:hypothetical protein
MVEEIGLPADAIPTNEQRDVVQKVVNDRVNATVDAVAGSGKTTTVHHVATEMQRTRPQDLMLMLTYSRRLKDDAEEKLKDLPAAHVHTFHSFAGVHYLGSGAACNDDVAMMRIIATDMPPVAGHSVYDAFVVDEVQDMTSTYFQLFAKVLRDQAKRDRGNRPLPQLLILGDCQQAIYGFQGADCRYLRLASRIWSTADHLITNAQAWATLTLHQSFRVPRAVTSFVNALSDSRDMVSHKLDAPKPRYVFCDTFNFIIMVKQVELCLESYAPEEVFILAPSVRGSANSPVTKLANMLTDMAQVPICVTSSDNETLSPEVMRGKLVMTTYHQAKGLERKAVIVLGMDASYFEFFDSECEDTSQLPNTNYVALTRSLESLTIIQQRKLAPMPCIVNAGHAFFELCCVVEPHNTTDFASGEDRLTAFPALAPPKAKKDKDGSLNKKGKDLTESLRFLQPQTLIEQIEKLNITKLREAGKLLPVCDTTDSTAIAPNDGKGNAKEGVAEITGTAIPFDFQLRKGIPLSEPIFHKYIADFVDFTDSDSGYTTESKAFKDGYRMSTQKLLQCTTGYCAERSALKYKRSQIQAYAWLSEATRDAAFDRMCALELGDEAAYEVPFREVVEDGPHAGSVVSGVADAIDQRKEAVYEFKFTGMLTSEHIVQLACYMHMFAKRHAKAPEHVCSGVLYNIRSDEMVGVEAEAGTLESIWSAIHGPKKVLGSLTDDEFVQNARRCFE